MLVQAAPAMNLALAQVALDRPMAARMHLANKELFQHGPQAQLCNPQPANATSGNHGPKPLHSKGASSPTGAQPSSYADQQCTSWLLAAPWRRRLRTLCRRRFASEGVFLRVPVVAIKKHLELRSDSATTSVSKRIKTLLKRLRRASSVPPLKCNRPPWANMVNQPTGHRLILHVKRYTHTHPKFRPMDKVLSSLLVSIRSLTKCHL